MLTQTMQQRVYEWEQALGDLQEKECIVCGKMVDRQIMIWLYLSNPEEVDGPYCPSCYWSVQ